MTAPGRALGLDLGSKRIGVALSDSDGRVATPYQVIERSGDIDQDHRRIREIAAEEGARRVVVGLPLSLDGSVGPAARGVLAEVERLAATIGLDVETYDERLTTVTADRSLTTLGMRTGARRQVVDMVAAAVILQAWLDHRTEGSDP